MLGYIYAYCQLDQLANQTKPKDKYDYKTNPLIPGSAEHMRRWINMLGQRQRRWAIIQPSLGSCREFSNNKKSNKTFTFNFISLNDYNFCDLLIQCVIIKRKYVIIAPPPELNCTWSCICEHTVFRFRYVLIITPNLSILQITLRLLNNSTEVVRLI